MISTPLAFASPRPLPGDKKGCWMAGFPLGGAVLHNNHSHRIPLREKIILHTCIREIHSPKKGDQP